MNSDIFNVEARVVVLLVLLLVGCDSPTVPVLRGELTPDHARLLPIGGASALNRINVNVYRRHPIFTHGHQQVASYYAGDGEVIIAARRVDGSTWRIHHTGLFGDISNPHRNINFAVDGNGGLHLAWGHHADGLRYAYSDSADDVRLQVHARLIGSLESQVTYPEFQRLAGGDLLLFYRTGVSGAGDLVLNRYDAKNREWHRLHDALVSGQGTRSAYWQTAVGPNGAVHLSWTWREGSDAATNHDIAYAVSYDSGLSWLNSRGTPYSVPITMRTAEHIARIPQGSSLINQTSMAVSRAGRVAIATYWKSALDDAPTIRLLLLVDGVWSTAEVHQSTNDFALGGRGSLQLPLSRPAVFLEDCGELLSLAPPESGRKVGSIGLLVDRPQATDGCAP